MHVHSVLFALACGEYVPPRKTISAGLSKHRHTHTHTHISALQWSLYNALHTQLGIPNSPSTNSQTHRHTDRQTHTHTHTHTHTQTHTHTAPCPDHIPPIRDLNCGAK